MLSHCQEIKFNIADKLSLTTKCIYTVYGIFGKTVKDLDAYIPSRIPYLYANIVLILFQQPDSDVEPFLDSLFDQAGIERSFSLQLCGTASILPNSTELPTHGHLVCLVKVFNKADIFFPITCLLRIYTSQISRLSTVFTELRKIVTSKILRISNAAGIILCSCDGEFSDIRYI